jgi:hypothetical protein
VSCFISLANAIYRDVLTANSKKINPEHTDCVVEGFSHEPTIQAVSDLLKKNENKGVLSTLLLTRLSALMQAV